MFDYVRSHGLPAQVGIVTRKPRPKSQETNVFRPYTSAVWAGFLATSLVASLFIGMFYWLYSKSHLTRNKLVPIRNPTDVFLPFLMLFQPLKIPWFQNQNRTSGGSILVLVWTTAGIFFFVWSYHTNLEANLAVIEMEKQVDSINGWHRCICNEELLSKPFVFSDAFDNGLQILLPRGAATGKILKRMIDSKARQRNIDPGSGEFNLPTNLAVYQRIVDENVAIVTNAFNFKYFEKLWIELYGSNQFHFFRVSFYISRLSFDHSKVKLNCRIFG